MSRSDKQLRQRVGYGIARVGNLIEEGEATRDHLQTIYDELTERIEGPSGIWISRRAIMDLPDIGPAFDAVDSLAAEDTLGLVDLSDQDSNANVVTLAQALLYARTGDEWLATRVQEAIDELVLEPTYQGRALALGRNLAAFVIAADIIELSEINPTLDASFRSKLIELRTTPTSGAASSLIDSHERRPNNWGTHAGASRAAIAAYLGDTDELERTADVFRGYLGDRSAYAGFDFGGPWGQEDHSWEADPSAPVGVNPVGSEIQGRNVDGVLPDDQRRGGSFFWPPPQENYVWEALQGAIVQAEILSRAGYPAWEWEDRALLRAVTWLHDEASYPAEGDDTWQPWLINRVYGTSFPTVLPARHGKNMGFTDWTHA